MSLIVITLIVGAAGAVGGCLNAVQLTLRGSCVDDEAADKGPVTSRGPWKWVRDFGFAMILGFAAAILSWSLYGPFTLENIIQSQPVAQESGMYNLTLGTLGTAVIIGLGGSRWLSNEADKELLKAAVVDASLKPDNPDLPSKLIGSSPEQIRNLTANTS